MSTDASERGPPMRGRGDRAKKYWDMTKAEAAERFDLDHLVEGDEPDASAGWREEYDHQAVEEGGHE